jgi:hypothetical protein
MDRSQRFDLDGIAEGSAGAMRLDVGDIRR